MSTLDYAANNVSSGVIMAAGQAYAGAFLMSIVVGAIFWS